MNGDDLLLFLQRTAVRLGLGYRATMEDVEKRIAGLLQVELRSQIAELAATQRPSLPEGWVWHEDEPDHVTWSVGWVAGASGLTADGNLTVTVWVDRNGVNIAITHSDGTLASSVDPGEAWAPVAVAKAVLAQAKKEGAKSVKRSD